MATTLEEIAKVADVSIATVSRVLTNSNHPISEKTRYRIKKLAEEMGYKPNLVARSLRTDRTYTVGIIADDIVSPFPPPIIRGIQDILTEHNYVGLIVNADRNPEIEKDVIDTLLSRPVDGIIFVESGHRVATKVLEHSNKPYVFVHRLFETPIKNSVVPDEAYGAALAVKHLVTLGHRRIAHIRGPVRWFASEGRLAGYRSVLETEGIAIDATLIESGDWEVESGYEAATRLLALEVPPTAIFSANDMMAIGAIYAIQNAGMRIPEDIAVVGYDNREVAWTIKPNLTTVNLPVYEMGRTAAEILLKQLQDGIQVLEEVRIKGQLFIRESCGADESLRTKDKSNFGIIMRKVVYENQTENM
jgi:DNA-binding LacI/PurR family transcriptional regulator